MKLFLLNQNLTCANLAFMYQLVWYLMKSMFAKLSNKLFKKWSVHCSTWKKQDSKSDNDQDGFVVTPLKWASIKKLERQGMTYELLLETFSMEKLNSLLYCNCSVNSFTVLPELTKVSMLDIFRCTLQSVANHVIVWDRNHAKRGEYVLSIRSAEWPLQSVFVEQCCSCV